MAELFAGDAVQNNNVVTLPNGSNVACATGNFVIPPYGNCKARVRGSAIVTLGSVPTSITLFLMRNPAGEALIFQGSGSVTGAIAAGAVLSISLDAVDPIPDGRPVQYQLLINGAGTGTNGSCSHAYIEAILLSG